MTKFYKTNSKRMIARDSKGRFKSTELSDILPGAKVNNFTLICNECHAEFTPILSSASCRVCGSKSHRIKPINISLEIKEKYRRFKELVDVNFIDPASMSEIQRLEIQIGEINIEYLRYCDHR